jgi:hypothetical protein
MATNGNWFAVSRTIFNHYLVGIRDRPYTEFEAWLWLLANAEFEQVEVINKGHRIVLDPGQMMASHGYLAEQWMWTVDKVRYFIKRLQNEAMIDRFVEEHRENTKRAPSNSPATPANHTKQNTGHRTNQIQVLTICNYGNYQIIPNSEHQANSQRHSQARTKRAPSEDSKSHQQYKDNTKQLNTIPPTPQGGQTEEGFHLEPEFEGEPASKVRRSRKPAAEVAAARADVQQAVGIFNRAADHFQFSKVDVLTPARALRLAKRLDEIGGVERFRLALRAIAKDAFLAGKVAGKDGKPAFRLDLERLLQTDGAMGDVLARLLDLAASAAVPSRNGKEWGWWRADIAKMRSLPADYWRERIAKEKPNGTWPWWSLGAPPGDPECVIHPEVVAENNFVEIYKGQVVHD